MATRIWIDDACICCTACVHTYPDVFAFPDDHAVVLGDAREDRLTDRNDTSRTPLLPGFDETLIDEAVEGCPVEIIHLERCA